MLPLVTLILKNILLLPYSEMGNLFNLFSTNDIWKCYLNIYGVEHRANWHPIYSNNITHDIYTRCTNPLVLYFYLPTLLGLLPCPRQFPTHFFDSTQMCTYICPYSPISGIIILKKHFFFSFIWIMRNISISLILNKIK